MEGRIICWEEIKVSKTACQSKSCLDMLLLDVDKIILLEWSLRNSWTNKLRFC